MSVLDTVLHGDALEKLKELPDKFINCCVTSPPYYGLRDYGEEGQIGLEKTPEEYVEKLISVFREVKRVLRDDGTLWLNLGDSYASGGRKHRAPDKIDGKGGRVTGDYRPSDPEGLKPKDLIGIPWKVAFALQADGWYLRQDIIWHKTNPMPESVKDRCTKSHEYIFLLSKSQKYYFDNESIKELAKYPPGTRKDVKKGGFDSKYSGDNGRKGDESFRAIREMRNKRSVWTVPTKPYSGAHFAVFPEKLIEPCILAGCPGGGVVLDPFFGSGTTGKSAVDNHRHYVGIEINKSYIELSKKRIRSTK